MATDRIRGISFTLPDDYDIPAIVRQTPPSSSAKMLSKDKCFF